MVLSIEARFGRYFRSALRRRFRRLPSAAFVANQFNLRSCRKDGVTSETIRRWMRGVSMPSYENLQILVDWLDLDCRVVFRRKGKDLFESPKDETLDAFRQLNPDLRESLLRFVMHSPMIAQQLKLAGVNGDSE